jgi:2-C-methyl-D-erythritol 4-phosphate cytidylyltransferase / 2-C-methyl-D-erythritol 2,4-cyclodiphosphate synthase
MMNSNLISVIIPAAGASSRFKKERGVSPSSKIFETISDEPLISKVLRELSELPEILEILIVVRAEDKIDFKKKIIVPLKLEKRILVVVGGTTRSESVWNGLRRTSRDSAYVCIHDAARPFIRKEWVRQLAKQLNDCDGIVLGKRVVPTVKELQSDYLGIKRTLTREKLFEAETPQLLRKNALIEAYKKLGMEAFRATDDASLLEVTGRKVITMAHDDLNLKITTQNDLNFARAITKKQSQMKFGLGVDGHELVKTRPFFLGGVRLSAPFGPKGHSDGDVLLHAVTDAILGALGLGDIGDHFSDRDPRWKNVKSKLFIKKTLELTRERLYRPVQLDTTVFLNQPTLKPYKNKIKSELASMLSLPLEQVNVKAKTWEGFGSQGAANSVSCQAFVVLEAMDS